jgi:hypothetical protein
VVAIATHGLTAFPTSRSSLLCRELVGFAADVGGSSPFACDLALPLLIHRRETALASFHDDTS